METQFLVIFTFMFFHRFYLSSNTIITTFPNVTCIEKERQSLLVFKRTLTDSYDLLSTWRGVECCEWKGVECDSRNGHVVKLDLRTPAPVVLSIEKQLEGKLSPSLQNLKYLSYLDLSMNRFSGNIPKFLGSFEHLEYLNLSGSFSSGVIPHHIGNLSRLQYLDLRNFFQDEANYEGQWSNIGYIKFTQAPIIDNLGWVSSLSALRYLDLSGITIGNQTDWLHPINMLPSLLTLNLASTGIAIPYIKFVNLTSLNSLDLSLNDINSTLPVWLSNLTSLMHLNLQRNQLHGKFPDFIGMFISLASIELSGNSFETSFPDLLCNLSTLIRLDLSGNRFSGSIPASLGLLLRLENLYLSDNQLSGNIPMSLGQLSELKHLDLSQNSLVGVLFEAHFAMLKNLNYLALSWNSLGLNFSSQWNAPFQLKIFFASSCNIGPQFPKLLQTQRNLRRLDISNSSIRDTIPEWFENILSHILYMDLSKNQISGKLPQLHFSSSSYTDDGILRMNSNIFEGSLATFPSNVYILDLSDNLLSGHVPKADGRMNPRLEVVNLSKNRFTGSIPVHLCNVPSIQVLDLSHNKFSGSIPRCLGNLTNLNVIDLTNNTMTGVVPSSLSSLKDLISLHLHNNRFNGELPASLQNLMRLNIMDLGNNLFKGTIPFWIGKKLSNLVFLDLQSNKFTGKIPLQLCQLKALQYLSLAHNNITGTIPHCFGNLTGMMSTFNRGYLPYISNYEEYILASTKGRELLYTKTMTFLTSLDLSSNNIIREIPDALMDLSGLRNLNLSRNLLKGQIPMTIGDLNQLESLDISLNKLSGRIPQSLTILNYLSYLNVSFNNLSGSIPVGNQLQTLDDPSIYEGNNGLCGPPVLRSCNSNALTYNHGGVDGGQDDTEDFWFYAGMGPGFVVGLIGLLGSLHFNRRWRVAYFKTIENVSGTLKISNLPNLAGLMRKVFKRSNSPNTSSVN